MSLDFLLNLFLGQPLYVQLDSSFSETRLGLVFSTALVLSIISAISFAIY